MNRNCCGDSYAGDNISYGPHNAVGMAEPLDPCCHLHWSFLAGRAPILFCSALQDRSRWLGSTCHRCCLPPHHVYMALWNCEAV